MSVFALPSSQRAHTRQQFRHDKRFRQIIIRAEVQPGNAVFHIAFCRQQQHRGLHPGGAQLLQNGEPVRLRHHDIQQNAVIVVREPIGIGVFAVIDGIHGIVVVLENGAERI